MLRTCMQSICAIKSNVGQSIQGDSRVVRSVRGRTAEVFLLAAFPAVLHCSLDSCKVICDVVDLLCLISLSISFCLLFFHIFQIVGKYDLYALAKFVSVHEHAEIIYIDVRSKINCCSISYV